ncbi:hypothetical protein [Nocardia sp. BMG51109]|uniref:hypothetical protein n=1 Tax=Nocardia sp. BMG51109 TaxID=1056816 RepID=UPI0004B0BE0D|nr:hypothetical protein [Nocardia sp. BMG51109]
MSADTSNARAEQPADAKADAPEQTSRPEATQQRYNRDGGRDERTDRLEHHENRESPARWPTPPTSNFPETRTDTTQTTSDRRIDDAPDHSSRNAGERRGITTDATPDRSDESQPNTGDSPQPHERDNADLLARPGRPAETTQTADRTDNNDPQSRPTEIPSEPTASDASGHDAEATQPATETATAWETPDTDPSADIENDTRQPDGHQRSIAEPVDRSESDQAGSRLTHADDAADSPDDNAPSDQEPSPEQSQGDAAPNGQADTRAADESRVVASAEGSTTPDDRPDPSETAHGSEVVDDPDSLQNLTPKKPDHGEDSEAEAELLDPARTDISRHLTWDDVQELLPTDDSGYHVKPRDAEFLGRTPQEVQWWHDRKAPLGMTPEGYSEFTDGLFNAVAQDGVEPKDVDARLQGSSAHFFSGEHKTFAPEDDVKKSPYAQQVLQEWFGDDTDRPQRRPFDSHYHLGLDPEPSDYDVQISSDVMVDRCRERWNEGGISGEFFHSKYGFVNKTCFEETFGTVASWADTESDNRGREVVPALFLSSGPPYKPPPEISAHHRDTDWMMQYRPLKKDDRAHGD